MNKEKLLSLLPVEVIKEEDVEKRIQEERQLIEAGGKFVSRLSINRYLNKKLADFTIEERIHLFSTLNEQGFVYDENGLYFSDLDMNAFAALLEETFHLEDIYTLDEFYIENLLQGKDITQQEFTIHDETMCLREILEQFVFSTWGMDIGDTPNLLLMLVVKKALLGSYLAEKNVASLLSGKREIYAISILM